MSYPIFHGPTESPSPEANGFSFAVILGGALMIVGLGLVVFGVSMRDDSPLFALGGVVFGGGVLRLTTALSSASRRRRAYLTDPDDPRWHGGAGVEQLAGRSCAECRQKIVIGSDAVSCGACRAAIHVDCETAHSAIHDDRREAASPR